MLVQVGSICLTHSIQGCSTGTSAIQVLSDCPSVSDVSNPEEDGQVDHINLQTTKDIIKIG